MTNPLNKPSTASPVPSETPKAKYFLRSTQLRSPGRIYNPGDAIPEGLLSEQEIQTLLDRNILGHIGTAPSKPTVARMELTMSPSAGERSWAFEPLPAEKAVSPMSVMGLTLVDLNEQAIAAGWTGEAFTDLEAAAAYLSANFKG